MGSSDTAFSIGLRGDNLIGEYAMSRPIHASQFMLALALVGTVVALYDAQAIYYGKELWCPPPISGCNEVANSPYARIFDVPVGYFGIVYYLLMFALAALIDFYSSCALRIAVLLYAALGVCFSTYFLYIQVSFIHAFCIYCLVSAVTTLMLLATACLNMAKNPTMPA